MLCVLIVLVCVCVYVGVELMVSTYPTYLIQTILQRDLPYLYLPKNIIISTCQLPTNPLPYIVLINICLTLLGYFPGHIHA